MSTTTRNEAAERLVPPEYDDTNWETCPLCGDDGLAGDMRAKLIEWFAAERRATVERIRAAIGDALYKFNHRTTVDNALVLTDALVAILDEEAAR